MLIQHLDIVYFSFVEIRIEQFPQSHRWPAAAAATTTTTKAQHWALGAYANGFFSPNK